MIIILKGADFSASNIGTLSSWRITRSLGTGATYEGATSVDKGAPLTATVTIAEGYELGTAGVTVTMGGIVLSGAHSISDNVITISIAEVTGNVSIKVPTINTATGEEDTPDQPIDADVYKVLTSTDFEVIGNSLNPPYKEERPGRLSYTKFDILVSSDYIYKFDFESGISTTQIGIQFYNEYALTQVANGVSFNGAHMYDPGWQENGAEFAPPEKINNSPVACVRVTFRKDNKNSDITPDVVTKLTITRRKIS